MEWSIGARSPSFFQLSADKRADKQARKRAKPRNSPILNERERAARQALAERQAADVMVRTLRKTQAAQKVERLKRELDALRRFASGDPKAVARQAARIARELAGAVKEYGALKGASVAGAGPSVDPWAESAESVSPEAAPPAAGDGEAEFIAEARTLAKRVKALIEEQRRKAKDDDEIDRHARDAEEATSSLSGLGAGMGLGAAMPALALDVKI